MDEYQVLRKYEFDGVAIYIKRSTAAMRKWQVVIQNTRSEKWHAVGKEFTDEREAWQEFYGRCMAHLENEAALWYNHEVAKDEDK